MEARALVAAGLLLFAAPASADVLERLAATAWGHDFSADATCLNPHRFSFPADRSRLIVTWDAPITDYEGNERLSGGYDVLEEGERSLTLALHGESRLGPDGEPVLWVLQLLETGVYCWRTDDQTILQCAHPAMACPAPLPLS
ncbi:hypothetical protein [Pseudoroseicyclus tamaricis]|uniref:Uncharacterized protein n=1 Tax=Pseudoroseicyclus tamaricis TaxID=2705421 RepID=A0A6B2K5K1_9RHOB|nr:hypothetical protein [Pseudoroseicyclus tamaricis]NDV02056.1 hypothetical protein [Pseudoroseicyclus tamaricis]